MKSKRNSPPGVRGSNVPRAAGSRPPLRRWARRPPGHARPAEASAASRERVLREHVERAAARRGHDRARNAPDRRAFFTGKNGGLRCHELPFPVTQAVLDRGQERYNIYCTPCHDATGSGNGMVVQRGYRQPQSFHTDRLRQRGGAFLRRDDQRFGGMPDYRAQITPRDRWNIVAYIRALQLSQHAAADDVPGDPTKIANRPRPGTNSVKH